MQIAQSPGYVRFALCSFWVIGVLHCGHLRVCSFLSSPVCSFWFVVILVSGRFQMSAFFPASEVPGRVSGGILRDGVLTAAREPSIF